MKRIALLVMILACVPLMLGLGVGLWPGGGGSSGSSTPPASGVDSTVTLYENSDWTGDNTASLVIDAATDLAANQKLYATDLGFTATERVWCFADRDDVTAGDRLICALGSHDNNAMFGTVTTLQTVNFFYWVPVGYDLEILAFEATVSRSLADTGVAECLLAVETNADKTDRTFDPTTPYADNFVQRGDFIEIGPNSSNTGGTGDSELNTIGNTYRQVINETLAAGYMSITARSRTPTSADCNYIGSALISVYVRLVPE